ncbi:YjcQ family protein [Psychrobacillus lasiicapitis]|nr:YjcQ family protein [Psychrobacillus lasiicapitis]GGA31187.1 hypothetical protein GCM10011384_20860 [Psychrobacillus lasiicapitis]
MANDTKDIIVAILKYLEDSLDEERIDFNKVNPEALGISAPKHSRILSMMIEEGYIDGLRKIPTLGTTYSGYKALEPRITLKGIDYLEANKPTAKVYTILKEIKEWIPGY